MSFRQWFFYLTEILPNRIADLNEHYDRRYEAWCDEHLGRYGY